MNDVVQAHSVILQVQRELQDTFIVPFDLLFLIPHNCWHVLVALTQH